MKAKSQCSISEILTGLFVLAVIGALGFFTIIISGVDWLKGTQAIIQEVRFENVGALKVQDPVFVRGMKIGNVQRLRLEPDGVCVTLHLSEPIQLKKDYAFSIAKTSMLGGSCVEIRQGDAAEPLPEGTPLRGITPLQELGELVSTLRQSIDAPTIRSTLTNVQRASDDVAELTGRLRRGEGLVGKLLSAEDTTYADLRGTLANLHTLTQGLSNGKGLLGRLLNEQDPAAENFSATLASLRDLAEGLRNGRGLLGKLMREDDTSYADLRASLANIRSVTAKLNDPACGLGRLLSQDSKLVENLEVTAENLRNVSTKLERGEGTLGKLVNDDAVANEIEATLRDVRQVIDNLRDTAPITTFSSLFFNGL